MEFVIKVNGTYVRKVRMFTDFTPFKDFAQKFPDEESAEKAVDELLDEHYWRNFDRDDVTIIPYEK